MPPAAEFVPPARYRAGRRGHPSWLAAGIVFALIALGPGMGPARAAEPPGFPPRDFATYRPEAVAVKIANEERPLIDGDLSDPVWERATLINEFYQLDPGTGQPGTERTELRILYDNENLYFSVHLYDDPSRVVASIMTRDGDLGRNDFFRIYLDPTQTRRNAYGFEINALGARTDIILQNNTTMLREWDMIWAAEARLVEDGWVAEVMIPFRGLSFDPAQSDWGFDFQRIIRHRDERVRWTSIAASTQYTDVSRSGTLLGVSPDMDGIGLDIQTYERVSYRHQWEGDEGGSLFGRFGGNAYYKVTPTVTGTLTINPDFSDAPLDAREVNTTRFQLFQPETRDFFLQDVAAFEYGGRGFLEAENARPFFSRNIGLANGRPVAIIGGAKLSGEYNGIGIGALTTVTSGTGLTREIQVLSAARVTAPITDRARVGFIGTNGDPTGVSDNTLMGADFQWRNPDWNGKIIQTDLFYERSFSDTRGDDDAFGFGIDFPNEMWGGFFRFKQVGEEFFPALGFVNRRGIREYSGEAIRRDRSLGWRWVDVAAKYSFITDLDNRMQSRFNEFRVAMVPDADQLHLKILDNYERVSDSFNLPGGVPVAPGSYGWTNFGVYIQTNAARRYSVRADFQCCSFYNGDYFRVDAQFDMRPSDAIQISPRYVYTHIDLPSGRVNIHVVSGDIVLNFTPDMNLLTQIQYDNISRGFGLSARFRWEYEPGQEVFASFGQSALIEAQRFRGLTSQFSLRFGQTFNF